MARLGGNPQLKEVRNEDTRAANAKRRALADAYGRETGRRLYEAMQQQKGMTYVQYAEWLNSNGWTTRRGSQWTATQVSRVFKRLGLQKPLRQKKKR